MLKLKLQYFGDLMRRTGSVEKNLMLAKIEGGRRGQQRCWQRLKAGEGDNRGWGGWMASLTQWTWVWVSSGNGWWTGKPGVLQSMGSQRDTAEWLNWLTELKHSSFQRGSWFNHYHLIQMISGFKGCRLAHKCTQSLSPIWLFGTPWTVFLQAPLSQWVYLSKNTGVGCYFLLWGSSWPRDWTCIYCISCIGRWMLQHWAHIKV